jgi:transposase-like protein
MQRSEGLVLKVDQQRRVRRTAAQREALLAEYERSGLSGPEFARVVGVKYQTLAGWRQRRGPRARSAPAPAPSPVKWVEAVRADSAPDAGLRLEFPGGIIAAVANEQQAALAAVLVRAWSQPC